MTIPVIGITVSQAQQKNRNYNQSPSAYAEAITQAGGLPLLIPCEFPIDHIPTLFERIDGLLLSGGGDIDIRNFDGEPHPSISAVSEVRDRLEFALIKYALSIHIPILGICRGIQVINVALGGTLYTDIPTQFQTDIEHSTPDEKGRDYLAHEIFLESNSNLGRIIGQKRFLVNSFHHQAIQKTAPGLVVTAHASDGLIEAIELAGDSGTLIGVQWHPECMPDIPVQQELFKAFIAACQ